MAAVRLVYGNHVRRARTSAISIQSSHLAVIDVTDSTNVHMGLGALESSGQTTSSHLVVGKDMVDGVDSAGAEDGSPAGARQDVEGTRETRHLAVRKQKR